MKHIAIAGNIGSGKTALAGLLAKHYNWMLVEDNPNGNPYLYSFYEDMARWAFNIQIYFLNSRFRQILDIRSQSKDVIQDRTIYEDACIFAPNLHEMGLLSYRDFETYRSLFNMVEKFVQAPDLLIYLKAEVSTLVKQIQSRNREFEQGIRLDYLSSLNTRYEEWIKKYDKGKLLVVDVDGLDFVNKPEDLGLVIDEVDARVNGLF